ncbi:PTS fructose transporter subunit IIABC [Alteribacter natronophilus]|uniref:PTS fructose transporter subunit IIABC n=1 Tax=Alteribacter natronophilus TaxID=2583810 RepID=UPI00110DB72F|nr:PTS fructose transporter subunit IIABC [Alteribacter natronophilus]TMW71822.1 PTS fructose transporter subunit IIA [Alteribacter natronophilus]
MRITELLTQETVLMDLRADTKEAVIDEMAEKLDQAGKLTDLNLFKEAIRERESQSSTGIGEGVAIPHAKTKAVGEPAIAFARSSEGVDYDALDGQNSHLFFMIAASEGANNEHLQTLSRLSTLLMDESFRSTLMEASSPEEILRAVDDKETEKLGAEEKEQAAQTERDNSEGKPFVVAVTGCPTGIAHTYMAADGLKDKAKEMNIDIKVETNGSDGVRNRLTEQEIDRAEAVIIAADTKIEKERFAGKRLVDAPVKDGIRKPGELLEKATDGSAPVFKGEGGSSASESGGEVDRRPGFYRHLMNGVSNMLPFVVAGGILIALSFVFNEPGAAETHWFGDLLSMIGGEYGFYLMIPVLSAFIARSIADRPGFAAGMIGGLMAVNFEAGFLGGIIAGFLAGYLVLMFRRLFAFIPQSLDGIRTILILPLFGVFTTAFIMYYLVTPLNAFSRGIEGWLGGLGTGNIVLMGILLGAMMAVDMGGPINKAAFTFGIAMIEAGNYAPHAAIMAAGMVPPLGIAIATTFFKSKFTKQEQDAGKSNYVLGASFITEGAIPFAAADPGRVIPSIITGSAVAGGLAMLFGAATQAPHGGIFVLLLVENWMLYLLAILAGAAVTAVMLGFWKKPVSQAETPQ